MELERYETNSILAIDVHSHVLVNTLEQRIGLLAEVVLAVSRVAKSPAVIIMPSIKLVFEKVPLPVAGPRFVTSPPDLSLIEGLPCFAGAVFDARHACPN